jgi:pantoate--beta-alanine ligase
MNILRTIAKTTAARNAMRGAVGLVPTMGYLHEGHLSLVRRAHADNDHVIVTIFVNPTQFAPNEDLDRYPRDEQRDLALLEEVLATKHSAPSTHAVFIPTADEIYPPGFDDWVEVTGPIAERLEGAHRPGHFRGVTTVCARLFRITRPDRAYFGQKDAQQLRVIRRMVEEQHIPVDIIPMPIVREPDGLAMSSRNVYLSPEERTLALRLSQSLRLAERLVMQDGTTDASVLRTMIRDTVGAQGLAPLRIELDYVSVADEQTLEELDTIDRPALILLAARIGATRLIDNTIVVPKGLPVPLDLQALIEPR